MNLIIIMTAKGRLKQLSVLVRQSEAYESATNIILKNNEDMQSNEIETFTH